jgi:glycosyltransferase involved in cell wall biosynthesis
VTQAPLVSVLMNCYNGEAYLREAIESVLAQTYQNWEIIFWDNQSTDRSAEIAKSYPDERIRYFYAPVHTKLYEARNHAMEKANGEYIAFLDVDDWWLPHKLEQQIPLFDDPEVGFVYGNYWIERSRTGTRRLGHKGTIPTGWVLDELLESYFVGLLTLVVRRAALSTAGPPCDPRYHIIGDFDLIARLAVSWKGDSVQEPVGLFRLHGANETIRQRGRYVDEMAVWWKEARQIERIRSSPSFGLAETRITYLNAMSQILMANKKAARELLRALPWGRLKLRLFAALLLPTVVLRRLKS